MPTVSQDSADTKSLLQRMQRASLFHSSIATVLLAIVLIWVGYDNYRLVQERMDSNLDALIQKISQKVESARRATILLSHALPDLDQEAQVALLEKTRQLIPQATTLIVIDANGHVQTGVPADDIALIPNNLRNVGDRSYFQVPMQTGSFFISQPFRGRGFGHAPLIALSAAFPDRSGVVELSMDLQILGDIDPPSYADTPSSFRVLGENRVVLFDSSGTQESLAVATDEWREGAVVHQTIPSLNWIVEIQEGWWSAYRQLLMVSMVGITLVLLFTLFSIFYARQRARRIAVPLQTLADALQHHAPLDIVLPRVETAEVPELALVVKALTETQQQLRDSDAQLRETLASLEAQVRNRTRQLRQERDQNRYLAEHDELTELYNRRFMMARMQQLSDQHHRRAEKPFAVVFLDLDELKSVNDFYGHHYGDAYVKAFAGILAESMGEADTVARLSGDEFVVLFDQVSDEATLKSRVTELRQQIPQSVTIGNPKQDIPLEYSLGATRYRKGESISGMLNRADKLMYAEKQAKKPSC